MYASQNRRRQVVFVAILSLLMLFTSIAATSAAESETNTETAVSLSANSTGYYYTIQWGDTLSVIAQVNGITVQAIMLSNPQITNPNFIYYGQVIFIPTGYVHPVEPPPPPPCRYYHYISYGETLSGIAAWYGVSPWAIAQANGLYNLNHIYAGQYLCIP